MNRDVWAISYPSRDEDPTAESHHQVGLWIPRDMYERISKRAEQLGLTVDNLLNALVYDDYIDMHGGLFFLENGFDPDSFTETEYCEGIEETILGMYENEDVFPDSGTVVAEGFDDLHFWVEHVQYSNPLDPPDYDMEIYFWQEGEEQKGVR